MAVEWRRNIAKIHSPFPSYPANSRHVDEFSYIPFGPRYYPGFRSRYTHYRVLPDIPRFATSDGGSLKRVGGKKIQINVVGDYFGIWNTCAESPKLYVHVTLSIVNVQDDNINVPQLFWKILNFCFALRNSLHHLFYETCLCFYSLF